MPSESNTPQAVGSYPVSRQVGNLLFISGMGPRLPKSAAAASSVPGLRLDANGNYLEFSFEAQVHSVEFLPVVQDGRALKHVGELAHVPAPALLSQRGESRGMQPHG